MRSTLEFLNAYESDEADEALSDLIEVCVPFGGEDAWGASNEFVIFDSPGSNSVSNEEHSLVLKRAMEGMSNGLPVYVVTYDSLDTTDNQDLYEQIEQIDAIDERFAMIVVNKADLTTLPIEGMTEELRSRIRQSAVYQSMYAMGIYFVASIAGLGAKTGGTFLDESYEERYESCKAKYGDPENKYHRALYRYDILPGQAATRVIEESGDCEDLVLANSGLYCVEREIERFATRYAAYNKCHQSEGLLGRLIDITREETTRKKHGHERSMRTYTRQLNRGEAALVSSIDASETKLRRQALESYEDEMDRALGPVLPTLDVRDLEVLESRFTERRRDELEYDQEREDIGEALRDALDNVRDRFAGGEGLIDAVASAVRGVREDMAVARDEVRDFLQAKQEADRLAASDIIEAVQSRYDDELGGFASRAADASESYWKKRAEAIRDELYGIATNCAELSEDRRRELGELIVQYAPLTLGAGNGIFERGDFRFWPLFRMVHPLNVERLDLAKVSRTYRDEMATAAANIRQDVGNSHGARFVEWVDELMAVIRENITEYNPDLREKVESIRFEESSISQLESALSSLGTAVDRVRRLLAWRG